MNFVCPQHLAFALTGIMAFAIPDVPREIKVQIQREKMLATEALYENDLARLQRETENHHLNGRSSGLEGSGDTSESSAFERRDPAARRGSSVGHDLVRNFHRRQNLNGTLNSSVTRYVGSMNVSNNGTSQTQQRRC